MFSPKKEKPSEPSPTYLIYKNPASGLLYQEIGEAFAHPAGCEGRIDVVLRRLEVGSGSPELVTVPFSELHRSKGATLERVKDLSSLPSSVFSGSCSQALELGEPRCCRHFKGGLYQILGSAKSMKTGGEELLYRTLYSSNFALFTRPRENFEADVGPAQKRFVEVPSSSLDDEAQGRLLRAWEPVRALDCSTVGRVALVTGASSGLGKATALHLAELGFLVFAAARSADRLAAELREMAPRRVIPLTLDVCKDDSVGAAFEQIRFRVGRLDVLVNNAGVLVVGTAEMVSVKQAKDMFDTNFFGAMRCMHEALAVMRPQGSGCIINVSSIFGEIPTMNQPVYAASKAALDSLTLGTREAVRPFGVSVHSLQPGGITDTEIGANLTNGDRFKAEDNPYPIDDMVKSSVFDRIVPNGQKSQDVAQVIGNIALGKTAAPVVQTGDYTKKLAEKKLKDVTGAAVVALKY